MTNKTLLEKLKNLKQILRSYDHIIVALSGGVDSTFLLSFACEAFADEEGSGMAYDGVPVYEHVSALTATGPHFARDEIQYAERLCDILGLPHKNMDVSHVMGMIKRNPPDRCYHCKREIFGLLKERAEMTGAVICDGTNMDDMADYRPGHRAIQELGIASPLKEAGLTKAEIREALSQIDIAGVKEMADKPAFACLASRVPYGETITEQKLEAVYEAEKFIKSLGFPQVRVRCHEIAGKVTGNDTRFMARIELEPEDLKKFCTGKPEQAGEADSFIDLTEQKLKELGFQYVSLDLGGYSKGKLNGDLQPGGEIPLPDRIKVTETAVRGNAENFETAGNSDIMAEIDRFLQETQKKNYSFNDFVDIIEKLRLPGGCPWDREQTHESLKKHMVEEANEALDAIDEGDWQHLCEELGDVLLQIVLHAQIAREAGEFDINDVVQSASEKMVRRHPHVFGNIDISSVDEGLDLWEEIKKREKQLRNR